jgi:hypothetical protein
MMPLMGEPVGERGKPTPNQRAGRQRRARIQRERRVTLAEVRRARYAGLVAKSMLPIAVEAERELGDLLADKGDGVTAAERAVLEDVARLGLLLRATFAAYLEAPDPDLAKTISTLAGQRRASLAAVGLERRAKELTAIDYIEAKAEPDPVTAEEPQS